MRSSTSSEEFMDISDEVETNIVPTLQFFADKDAQPKVQEEKTVMDQASELIRDADRSKARVFDLAGRQVDINAIDNDYQMIDAHIEEGLRKKVLNLEYIEFGKLLSKNWAGHDEDNRLKFVTKNGATYLSPVADREGGGNITSYAKWEQAFRVFSNILTSRYPDKATELLQYNHTIHTASMSYIWENVYAYDKEFRHHIA